MEKSQEGVGQGTEEGDTAQAAGSDSKDEMVTQPLVQETSPTAPSSEIKFEYSSKRMTLTQAKRRVLKTFGKKPNIIHPVPSSATAFEETDAPTDSATETGTSTAIASGKDISTATATATATAIATATATDSTSLASRTTSKAKDPSIVKTITDISTARAETDPLIATTTDIHTARTIASTSADARATAGIETFIAPDPTDHPSATTATGPSTGTAAGFSNASTQTTAAVITKNDTSTDDSSTSDDTDSSTSVDTDSSTSVDTDTSSSTDTSTDADTFTYTGHVRKFKHSLVRKFIKARKKPPQRKPIPASEDELFELLESDD